MLRFRGIQTRYTDLPKMVIYKYQSTFGRLSFVHTIVLFKVICNTVTYIQLGAHVGCHCLACATATASIWFMPLDRTAARVRCRAALGTQRFAARTPAHSPRSGIWELHVQDQCQLSETQICHEHVAHTGPLGIRNLRRGTAKWRSGSSHVAHLVTGNLCMQIY